MSFSEPLPLRELNSISFCRVSLAEAENTYVSPLNLLAIIVFKLVSRLSPKFPAIFSLFTLNELPSIFKVAFGI